MFQWSEYFAGQVVSILAQFAVVLLHDIALLKSSMGKQVWQ